MITNAAQIGLDVSAREVQRSVDLCLARECRGVKRLSNANAATRTDSGKIPRSAVADGGGNTAGDRVEGLLSRRVIETPVGRGPGVQDCRRVRSMFVFGRSTFLPRGLFECIEESRDNLRFGLHFQPGGARGPCGVASQHVLLGGRNVTLRPVGEFDVEVRRERRLRLQFQAGQCVDLIRERRDRQFANTDRLQFDFGILPLVKDDCFLRVNLALALGQVVLHARDDWLGPFETLFVGNAVIQAQCLLDNGERRAVVILHLFEGSLGVLRDALGIGIHRDILLRRAVIHPHEVAAGPLRHCTDECSIPLARLTEHCREVLAEQAVIIRRHGRRTEVMLRVVGKNRDGLALGCLQGDHGQAGINRTRGTDHVLAEITRVHVRENACFAKWVDDLVLGLANPAAVVRVFPIVDRRPSDLGGLQLLERVCDCFRDLRGKTRRVFLVLSRSEASHRGGGGMRVCRGDHDVVNRDATLRGRLLLGFIDQGLSHHACVDDCEGDLCLSVIENDRADV